MSFEKLVEDHHKLEFSGNVKMVAQQMQNPIRNAVTIVPATGEAQDAADLIGKLEYEEGEDRSRRNPENVPNRSRRWLVRPTVIETGQYLDKEDKFDAAMDPTSPLFRNHVLAVERGVQDRILGVRRNKSTGKFEISGSGVFGTASEGKRGGTKKTLPAANYVPHASAGLTTEKLRAAAEAMELEDFGFEGDMGIYCAISPKQKTDLLNLALATKTQLNQFDLKQIETGKPTTLLGITWIFTNRLPYNADGQRLLPMWTKDNIVCGMWQDVQGRIWNDGSAKNLPYIYADAYPDAVRIEDIGVRIIECVES
ncbi:MAG: phage capsid protein [Pseudomonadota bacterium]